MSSEALPISPARFAEAIRDLSPASLHLKTLELRNSLAHLAYSNAQLRPFADGTQASLDGQPGRPDPDCVDAMRENEAVMARMRGRVALVRAEVERRGMSWREFEAKDELGGDGHADADAEPGVVSNGVVNGRAAGADTDADTDAEADASSPSGRNPWTDGTFQTGVIRNGEVHMDAVAGQSVGLGAATTTTTITAAASSPTGGAGSGPGAASGGRLSDEELRRLLEQRLAGDGNDEDGGMHL